MERLVNTSYMHRCDSSILNNLNKTDTPNTKTKTSSDALNVADLNCIHIITNIFFQRFSHNTNKNDFTKTSSGEPAENDFTKTSSGEPAEIDWDTQKMPDNSTVGVSSERRTLW